MIVNGGGGDPKITLSVMCLQKGDVVECEIDEIGTIRNEIQ